MIKAQDRVNQHRWEAHISPLPDINGKRLTTAELSLDLEDSAFTLKSSLFVAVVDRSGSMKGEPWKQVATALIHITSMARLNPRIKVCIVAYDSTAQIYNPEGTRPEVEMMIKNMFTGGGTNFMSAFEKIKFLLNEFFCSEDRLSSDHNVSNVTVVFMTDGLDATMYDQDTGLESQKDVASKKLVSAFKTIIQDSWKDNPISVHSVGFGHSCSKEFLEGMRLTGNQEGTFRFAEPTDDGDTLCNKLNSLFEVASQSSSVPISIFGPKMRLNETINFAIGENNSGTYKKWVTVDDYDNMGDLVINSSKDIGRSIGINLSTDKNITKRWISKCTDDVASEFFQFVSNKTNYSDKVLDLYLNLLVKKIDALFAAADRDALGDSEALISRIEFIKSQLINYLRGSDVNMGKLGDVRFSSIFRERIPDKLQQTNSITKNLPKLDIKPANSERRVKYTRNNQNKGRNTLQEAICSVQCDYLSRDLENQLQKCTIEDAMHLDNDGNNALHLAAYCGQSKTVKSLGDKFCPGIDLNLENKDGETAVTLAIKKRGFRRTLQILLDNGGCIPESRQKGLEQYAIATGYVDTADIISNYKSNGINSLDVEINEGMTRNYVSYMWKKVTDKNLEFSKQKYLEVGLKVCMTSMVVELLDKYNVEPTIQLCEFTMPPKPDHEETSKYLELTKLLIKKRPAILNEYLADGDSILSAAVRAGSLPHVQYLLGLENVAQNLLDRPNNLGNTPLWLACAKRFPCIITELINHGADINKRNIKGNPPLYNICQKGPLKVAEQFVSMRADLMHCNENGDTLVLICCRNGQHDILKLFLNYVDPEFVDFKAHIDGFNAIFASVEQNKVECIKVLHEYGVDLNQKTAPDNPILPSATPLHLAAFYGRVEAAKTLLALGSDPSSKGLNDQTPLHLAVIQSHESIVKGLLAHGADKTAIDRHGNTPASYGRDKISIRQLLIDPMLHPLMHLARGSFSKEETKQALDILQREKISIPGVLTPSQIVNIVDERDGSTPLMQSIIYSNYPIAKTLMELDADPLIKNSMGINCLFWAEYMRNPRISKLVSMVWVDDFVMKQLKNLKKYNSVQDLECVFLGTNPPPMENFESSGIDKRMEGSFNDVAIELDIVQSNSTSFESSIMEMIKYAAEYKQQKISIDHIIWNGKVHTVGVLAKGESLLNAVHVFAISTFTNNSLLSNVINNSKNLSNNYIKCLIQGLNILPPFEEEVFVGVNNLDRSKFAIGNEIKIDKIISGSTMWRVAVEHLTQFTSGKKKKGTVLLIKSKTGRHVAPYSSFGFDSEILFLPGTRFGVKRWYRGDVICLGQENIRQHSFGIDDVDKPRYMTDRAMIIELHEIDS